MSPRASNLEFYTEKNQLPASARESRKSDSTLAMTTQRTNRCELTLPLGSTDTVKAKLLALFFNYGDFNQRSETHLTHSQFLRLVRDAGITISENKISIMMSSCLQTKTNLIKSISFPQFLELCSALSELLTPKIFAKNPKRALAQLLSSHLLVLLNEIEGRDGLKEYGLQAAYSQSLRCQERIVYNDDTMAIMMDI